MNRLELGMLAAAAETTGNSLVGDLFVNILAGIILATVGTIVGLAWRTAIWPHLLSIFATKSVGVNISGPWKTISGTAAGAQAHVHLTQVGYRVTGEIIWIEGGRNLTYTLEGDYRDTVLIALFRRKNDEDLDRGTFTVKYMGGGTLNGCFAWYERKENGDRIVHGDYTLQRE